MYIIVVLYLILQFKIIILPIKIFFKEMKRGKYSDLLAKCLKNLTILLKILSVCFSKDIYAIFIGKL